MLHLRRVAWDDCDWERLDALADRGVYQTREWLTFVARTQRAEPVVAELRDARGGWAGCFTGLVVTRFGVRILGSPFPGWGSGPMGFNLLPDVSRRHAVEALLAYALGPLRCLHLELLDRRITLGDVEGLEFRSAMTRTYAINLRRDEDAIFAAMSSACRRAIRRSRKLGVTVEEATGADFADEYHAQLVDVFAKQSLEPTVGVERVREMIRALEPAGRMLLLRARSADGAPIASAIFIGMNEVADYWGGASWRAHQELRPNEALMWHAIRAWKARGALLLDLGGGTEEGFAQYKRKFGPDEIVRPYLRRSRFEAIAAARSVAERVARGGARPSSLPARLVRRSLSGAPAAAAAASARRRR